MIFHEIQLKTLKNEMQENVHPSEPFSHLVTGIVKIFGVKSQKKFSE